MTPDGAEREQGALNREVEDDFARLGLPRRAALTAEEVRSAFQKAAASSHPDHAADAAEKEQRTAAFTKLNEAASRLTLTTTRLKHLLALEFPGHPGATRSMVMDETLVTLFTKVGEAVRGASQWAVKQRAATTFLAKAALAGEEMLVRGNLESAGGALRMALDRQFSELTVLDGYRTGGKASSAVADDLAALGQRAAFLEKWQAQLQSAWAGMFGAG